MKLIRKVGATSQIFQIFIADSSSTTGAGLAGLVFNSSGLTAYFHRDTDTTATAISLVTMTAGTFTSSGFKEIDATNMPGWYQFCPPNAALASGAASVGFHLKGATNMAPLPIEVDLDAQVDVALWNGTAVSSPATAGIPDVNVKNMNNVAATPITTIGANVGTTQPLNFSGAGASALVKSDTEQLNAQTVTAAAGVTFPSSVASPTNITAGTITTATNLTNAPTAGDFTATMKTSLNNATPSVTVSDKTGFSLSSAGIQAIWDALTSALTTAGSIGKLLVGMAASVWDVVLSGHTTAGTTGAALNSAGSAGDPWATALPGAYGAGTAGNIVGNNLNATVSSRFPTSSAPTNFSSLGITGAGKISEVLLTDTLTTYTGNTPQTGDSYARLGAPVGASISADIAGVPTTVWAAGARTLTSFGTLVADIATAVWGAATRTLSAFGFTVTTDVSSTVTTNLNATVSSRLPTSSYTAPPTAVANADALLGRNIAGGSSSGRTVTTALQPLRNKVTSAAGTLTVYAEDDTTVSWTSALTTDPSANPIVSSDPA